MDLKTAQSLMAKAAKDTTDKVAVLVTESCTTNARLERIEALLADLVASVKGRVKPNPNQGHR